MKQAYAERLIVSRDSHVIYCPIPAALSSNWKLLLRKFEGKPDYTDLKLAHDRNLSGFKYVRTPPLSLLFFSLVVFPSCTPKSGQVDLNGYGHLLTRFLNEFKAAEVDALLQDPSLVKFTFVRHPFHRTLSNYINKFSSKDTNSDEYKVFMAHLYGWKYTQQHDVTKERRVSFPE